MSPNRRAANSSGGRPIGRCSRTAVRRSLELSVCDRHADKEIREEETIMMVQKPRAPRFCIAVANAGIVQPGLMLTQAELATLARLSR
jgi:hypothetical protein